jgi:putative spermidine/putrescine transport system ATP-binding protein
MSRAIELESLSRHFGAVKAVDSIDLHIEDGRFYVLLGPSGCGKSTTLRLIAGLEAPTSGRVVIGGEDMTVVAPHKRDLGLVFQSYALFPHMTVARNIAFGLNMRGVDRADTDARVAKALSLVQLDGYGDRRPSQLSGGQQQRVALARALVIEPRALLLDEPLSNLDKKLRDEMRGQIREIQVRLGITTVMVTHDQEEALALGDRIVVMRDGRIEQIGSPEDLYRRPASRFVAGFIGDANLLEGVLTGDGFLTVDAAPRIRLPVASRDSAGTRATLVIRPSDARMEGGGGTSGLSGRVVSSLYYGSVRRYAVALSTGGTFNVDWSGEPGQPPAPGDQVGIVYDPPRCHVLVGSGA